MTGMLKMPNQIQIVYVASTIGPELISYTQPINRPVIPYSYIYGHLSPLTKILIPSNKYYIIPHVPLQYLTYGPHFISFILLMDHIKF